MTDHAHTLQSEALGVGESIIMGTAGSAPALSVSATMTALVVAVGVMAPASVLYCGLIMFGIAFAFQHLNRVDANAGASYSWASKIFSPSIGFLAGWSVIISSILFMVSGTIPAATATLALVAPDFIDNLAVVNLVAAAWVLVIGIIVAKGIKLTSYTQIVFTVVEVSVLVLLMALAILKFGAMPVHHIALNWFTGSDLTPTLFATGAITALFMFSGWDVTSNLNEETRNAKRVAGQGSVYAMAIVTALFLSFSAITLLVLTDDEIANAGTNLLFAVAQKLLPHPWDDIAILAVMLSTVGALETSILQFTRTLFAMARDGALHKRYARLHPVYRTPWTATILITLLGLVLLFLSTYLPSIKVVVTDSINAIGFQVAVYYGLAGLACAWVYRREALTAPRKFIFLFAWPLLGAGFLFLIALYSVPTFDLTTNLAGIGGIAIGVVPYLWNKFRSRVHGSWIVNKNHKVLRAPSGTEIAFPSEVVDIVFFNKIAVVLLKYNAEILSDDACQNVVAYDESGQMLWQIGPAPLSRNENPYTEIAKEDENTVLLGNWVGFTLYVDPTNGNILKKEETR